MSPKISLRTKAKGNWLPWQPPLRDRKTNFICSHSSTNPENLVKIGPVDFETIGVIEIVENKKKTAAEYVAHRA